MRLLHKGVSIISNNVGEIIFEHDAINIRMSREKTVRCPLEMSTSCQGAGFQARLLRESLPEV